MSTLGRTTRVCAFASFQIVGPSNNAIVSNSFNIRDVVKTTASSGKRALKFKIDGFSGSPTPNMVFMLTRLGSGVNKTDSSAIDSIVLGADGVVTVTWIDAGAAAFGFTIVCFQGPDGPAQDVPLNAPT